MNPSNGNLFIDAGLLDNEFMDLQVIDVRGRVVHGQSNALKHGSNSVDLNLPQGVYLLRAFNEKRSLRPARFVIR